MGVVLPAFDGAPTSFRVPRFRRGVAVRLELDLIGPADNRSRIGGTVATGYNDLGLGFKYELPQKGRFTYAVDGLFQAATGTGGFGAGGPTSAVNLAELVARTKLAPDRGGQVFTDFGVQKLLGPALEIDAEYGVDFTPVDGSRFHYVGPGVGVRVRVR